MARFTCYECGYPVDPDAKSTLRMVRGWAKGTTKTLVFIEQEDYKFVHEACLENAKRGSLEEQAPLF